MQFDSLKPDSIRDALLQSAASAEAYAKRCRAAVAVLTGMAVSPSPSPKPKTRSPVDPGDVVATGRAADEDGALL